MARKQKTDVALTPRKVKFKVKATPVVRKARKDLLNAVVACKGREADLEGLQETLEVVQDFLKARGARDVKVRKANAAAAVKAAVEAQKLLDNQRIITAEHDVVQARKGLAAAEDKEAALKERLTGLTALEQAADKAAGK